MENPSAPVPSPFPFKLAQSDASLHHTPQHDWKIAYVSWVTHMRTCLMSTPLQDRVQQSWFLVRWDFAHGRFMNIQSALAPLKTLWITSG